MIVAGRHGLPPLPSQRRARAQTHAPRRPGMPTGPATGRRAHATLTPPRPHFPTAWPRLLLSAPQLSRLEATLEP
jgi:hypothetical protein